MTMSSVWTTNFTALFTRGDLTGQPAGTFGGAGFDPPFDGAPWDTVSTDEAGNFWASPTQEEALIKFEALQRTLSYGSDVENASPVCISGYTDTFYHTEPEEITPTGYLPSYVISVWRFKGSSLADFSDEGSHATGGQTFWYTLFEIDDTFTQTITSEEYDDGNLDDPGGWDNTLLYTFIPSICSVTDSTYGQVFGEYIAPNADNDYIEIPSQYYADLVMVAFGESPGDSFQLALLQDGRWYPQDGDTVAPLKYKDGVSIVKAVFGEEGDRYAMIRPSKDGGFLVYETDSDYQAIDLIYVFRYDRTLGDVVLPELLEAYLP